MNLNPIFVKLGTAMGLEVEQDCYSGSDDKYGVWVYEDERGSLYGDDIALEDTCYMQFKLYTPKDYNYMSLKKRIRDWFESKCFIVTGISSFIEENVTVNNSKIRCTIFNLTYTDTH